ncbi:hypothetical protein EI555_008797 [Monodon monoceros]|uniref:Uncharacterized protein n=1 Tax=Monodon monoceros TaxID=40151 RepID=A0A4U1EV78_MONMO|nr:hypothetical protein EI555_008797 [Monodon monoceros]
MGYKWKPIYDGENWRARLKLEQSSLDKLAVNQSQVALLPSTYIYRLSVPMDFTPRRVPEGDDEQEDVLRISPTGNIQHTKIQIVHFLPYSLEFHLHQKEVGTNAAERAASGDWHLRTETKGETSCMTVKTLDMYYTGMEAILSEEQPGKEKEERKEAETQTTLDAAILQPLSNEGVSPTTVQTGPTSLKPSANICLPENAEFYKPEMEKMRKLYTLISLKMQKKAKMKTFGLKLEVEGAVVCGLDLSETKAARQRPWLLQEPYRLRGTHRLRKHHETGPRDPAGRPRELVQAHTAERRRRGDRRSSGTDGHFREHDSSCSAAAWPLSAPVAEPGSEHRLGCHQHAGRPRLPCCEGHRILRRTTRATPYAVAPGESQGTLNQGPPGPLCSLFTLRIRGAEKHHHIKGEVGKRGQFSTPWDSRKALLFSKYTLPSVGKVVHFRSANKNDLRINCCANHRYPETYVDTQGNGKSRAGEAGLYPEDPFEQSGDSVRIVAERALSRVAMKTVRYVMRLEEFWVAEGQGLQKDMWKLASDKMSQKEGPIQIKTRRAGGQGHGVATVNEMDSTHNSKALASEETGGPIHSNSSTLILKKTNSDYPNSIFNFPSSDFPKHFTDTTKFSTRSDTPGAEKHLAMMNPLNFLVTQSRKGPTHFRGGIGNIQSPLSHVLKSQLQLHEHQLINILQRAEKFFLSQRWRISMLIINRTEERAEEKHHVKGRRGTKQVNITQLEIRSIDTETLRIVEQISLNLEVSGIKFYSFKYLSVVYTHYAISTKDEFGDDENKETASARIRESLFLQTHPTFFRKRSRFEKRREEHARTCCKEPETLADESVLLRLRRSLRSTLPPPQQLPQLPPPVTLPLKLVFPQQVTLPQPLALPQPLVLPLPPLATAGTGLLPRHDPSAATIRGKPAASGSTETLPQQPAAGTGRRSFDVTSGRIAYGFEARNAKEKEQCVKAAMEKNRREFREYFRRLCISCIECMRDKKKTRTLAEDPTTAS